MKISSKLRGMISIIESIPHDSKIIVFAGTVSVTMLCKKFIAEAIESGEIHKRKLYIVIGNTTIRRRTIAFQAFQKHDSEGQILLTEYEVGGIGLNLTGCHFAILVELNYNPQEERQAASRM